MNSAERVQATVAGRPVDRRAVVPVLSLYGAKLTGCPLDRYYSDPGAYSQGQAAVRETFQVDCLCGPFDFGGLGEAFGSEVQVFAEAASNVRRPAVQSASEWDTLVIPDPDSHPRLVFLQNAIRRMVAEQRGEVPVVAILPPPIDIPPLVMGIEGWIETVLFDLAGARRVMEKVIPFFVRLANQLLAAGASFIASPCAFFSPAIVPREVVTDFSRPVMAEALAQVRGPVVLHHAGAPILAHLDLLAGLPSVIAFVLDEQDDLERGRRFVGAEPVLFGGPMGPTLCSRSVSQVEERCRAVLENRRSDPRFVLCTCGPDVTWETPPENIHALRRMAEVYGGPEA